jgi:hypothetical protein
VSNELPLLGGIAATLRWFEELLALLSGPLLVIGLGISLTDLLTDGQLLAHQPLLLYAWAISQAIGVDAGLVGAWDKARAALRERRYWALAGLLLLGTALAYIGWIAAQVFAVQQSQGVTTAVALSQLGMDDTSWLIQRSLLSVLLVCLSGWSRYHPQKATLDQEKAALRREAELLPLRQQVRRQKALGAVSLAKTMLTGKAVEPPAEQAAEVETPDTPTRMRGGTQLNVEDRIRRALTRNPALSGAELARIVGCSKSQALRIRRKVVGE